MTKHTIHIKELEIHAYHGVMNQENLVGNTFLINLSVETNFLAAIQTDEIEGTISYAELSNLIVKQMKITSKTLEHVAGRIVQAIRTEYPSIGTIYIELWKKYPPIDAQTKGVGISISDSRS